VKAPQKNDTEVSINQLFDKAFNHHKAGRVMEAQKLYTHVLALFPRHSDSLHLLGLIAQGAHNLEDAEALIAQAIQIKDDIPLYHSNLGNILKARGKVEDAILSYGRALTLDPHVAETHYNLATIFHDQRKLEDAAAEYEKALVLNPELVPAYNNLGNILRDQGKLDEAISCYQQALSSLPDFAEAHYNLGAAYKDQNKWDDAIAHYKRAIDLKPDYVEAHNNLGALYHNSCQFTDALSQFDAALSYKTDHVAAHVNKGMTHLVMGNFSEGWKEYEWRLHMPGLTHHVPIAPQWKGEDLKGKTILLLCEQGFGDSIQFIRYAAMVKNYGGRVLLSCPLPLARIFASVQSIDQIYPDGIAIPTYDYYSPLLSLPGLFDTRIETIPHIVPYLSASEDNLAHWASSLKSYKGVKVGLIWAGKSRLKNNDAKAVDLRRSMQLNQLVSLSTIPHIQFFSLQKDHPTGQNIISAAELKLIDLMDQVDDFADTAAFIAQLDLVIGVDTAVIHLAAALGKPVWVLSRFDACWRWLSEREDSPWYPSLRLFKQQAPGDWASVIERVRSELSQLQK
jgi:tetratricopeptide (TPR) repeat protein